MILLLRFFSLMYPLMKHGILKDIAKHANMVVMIRHPNSMFTIGGKRRKAPKYFLAYVVKRMFDDPARLLVDVPFAENIDLRGTPVMQRGWYTVAPLFFEKAYALPDEYWYGYDHIHGRKFAETPNQIPL